MYEHSSSFDPSAIVDGTVSLKDSIPDAPPLMAAGNLTSNNNGLEENLRLTVEELSYHHHQHQNHPPPHPENVSAFANGVAAAPLDISHPQHLVLNVENSYNNENLVHQVIDALSYDQSTWDPKVQELQDVGYSNHHHEQQQPQQFQQIETQSYNSSSILDPPPPYPPSNLLDLLHFNPSQKIPNIPNSMGFLGDIPIGSDSASACSVLYDPLLHLNLPPQPLALRELFQSLPRGYSLPTSSRNGSLFGGGDEIEGNGIVYQDGDGSQLDNGVLEFDRGTARVSKGRQGKGTKHFATEKQRREQLNGKYNVLRSLIPSPTKMDRASVVGDAIKYIKELMRTVNELKLLVEKKRFGMDRCKRHKGEDDAGESCNMKPYGDHPEGCIRTSWLQRKSKDTEVDVRIIDDEVTIKLVQRKKISCLLFVSRVLDELQLDLHHVAGGHVGEYCSFLFNSKICEGSSVYASAIANKVIEVLDRQYAAAVPHTTGSY
ncbi:transcription factor bHLH10-like [Prosopis cineraria]|uniref:transcription factor bHLH10-like n=1 Tax=Prosopis cineraria TaxID=364024 RepID=UPI00240EA5DF|nr:transcription factor bHLH10-like [Prosopis cineraria]XP_054779343.1 transcription factor bHLH10-like [Prosopis cineraria]XP_054779344.1 transcription factor bHLH10-like [Prosopis cineraria]